MAPRDHDLDGAWAAYADALAEMIETLDDRESVVLTVRGKRSRNRYVQLWGHDRHRRLWAESVSDHYLGPKDSLTPAEREWLLVLGWRSPSATTRTRNHYRTWLGPLRHLDIADILVLTLREVHGVTDPANLKMERFNTGTVLDPP